MAAGQTGLFYESVFEEMAAEGSMRSAAVIFPAERWYEIDTLADLARPSSSSRGACTSRGDRGAGLSRAAARPGAAM